MKAGEAPRGVDQDEAPEGYYAELKPPHIWGVSKNVCEQCDWRNTCLEGFDPRDHKNRCMPDPVIVEATGEKVCRKDGCSVVFKKREEKA